VGVVRVGDVLPFHETAALQGPARPHHREHLLLPWRSHPQQPTGCEFLDQFGFLLSAPPAEGNRRSTSFPNKEDRAMKATFGAGCFWGVELNFRRLDGVTDAAVGYAGGRTENPTYEDVCRHGTGHAEVVEVDFDPARISYDDLVSEFFGMHDPTQVNRQGPDIGDQYRSVIFFHSPEQKAAAERIKADLDASGRFARPIATLIEPATSFWRAEEYHQRYIEKRGGTGCAVR
jgi:peptide-methionine (S)-S-oxide reductase